MDLFDLLLDLTEVYTYLLVMASRQKFKVELANVLKDMVEESRGQILTLSRLFRSSAK